MISGYYKQRFSEANMACMVDVSMNSDYDFWYEIVRIRGDTEVVILKNGVEISKKIKRDNTSEYFYIEQIGAYETFMNAGKPSEIKCVPFFDTLGNHPYKPKEAGKDG